MADNLYAKAGLLRKQRQPQHALGIITKMTPRFTRTQAMAFVEPIMQRIKHEKWQDALNDELASKLTEETVAALSPSTKIWLTTWAIQADKPIVLQHLQKNSVNKFALPSEILLDDLFKLSKHPELNKEVKWDMKATIAALRQKIRNMEYRQQSVDRVKTMDRMNVFQSAMLAMKKDIEEYQAVAKPAARNNMDHIQDAIKIALQEQMKGYQIMTKASVTRFMSRILRKTDLVVKEAEKLQKSTQKSVAKRTHEEAFSNQNRK
ncbi:hypothetical protein MKX08_000155 [Trichoderma sp. CBMAI-0020]|nr:hypothetical protein MKX08_000155 [Trichoderma sp. CBMAI-0020]